MLLHEGHGLADHAIFEMFIRCGGLEIRIRGKQPWGEIGAGRTGARPVRNVDLESVLEWTIGFETEVPLAKVTGDIRLPLQCLSEGIECRIQAEDPDRGFLPSPGVITAARAPSGPGIRNDSAIYTGYDMPIHYDALLAKLIAWGADRDEAIERMARALREYVINGIPTTIAFHRRVRRDPRFVSGRFDTGYLDQDPPHEEAPPEVEERYRKVALVAAALADYRRRAGGQVETERDGHISSWKRAGRWEALR